MSRQSRKLTFMFLIFLFSVNICFSQVQISEILETRVSNFNIEGRDLGATLEAISKELSVPIGLECSDEEYITNIRINLNIKTSSLREVLDMITSQNPDYAWEINDGVVNFTPLKKRNQIVKNLLRTKISSFNPNRDSDSQDLKSYLSGLPEVRRLLGDENVFNFGVLVSEPSRKKLPDDVLSPFTNIEFRRILNEVVKKNNSKFWLIRGLSANLIMLHF